MASNEVFLKFPSDNIDWDDFLRSAQNGGGYSGDRVFVDPNDPKQEVTAKTLPIFLNAAEKFYVLNRGIIGEGKEFGEYVTDDYKIKRMDEFIRSYNQSSKWIKRDDTIKKNIFNEACYLIGLCKNVSSLNTNKYLVSFGSSTIIFRGTHEEIAIFIDRNGNLHYERS